MVFTCLCVFVPQVVQEGVDYIYWDPQLGGIDCKIVIIIV